VRRIRAGAIANTRWRRRVEDNNGTMDPATGDGSTLSDYSGGTKVIATLSGTDRSHSATATVTRCVSKTYHSPSVSLAGTTDGFSPHLGEACAIVAQFSPGYWRWTCHHNAPDEIEYGSVADLRICHAVIGGDNGWWPTHLLNSYIDIDATPSVSNNWGGACDTGQMTSPEVFAPTGDNRILPASNGYIAPPFFHVVARVWRGGDITAEPSVSSHKVYVPQVTRIRIIPGTATALTTPIYYTDNTTNVLLYAGCTIDAAQTALNSLSTSIAVKYPPEVNIRFIASSTTIADAHTLWIDSSDSNYSSLWGRANPNDRNAAPAKEGTVYIGHILGSLPMEYEFYLKGYSYYIGTFDSINLPLQLGDIINAIANTTTHEPTHMLGGVSPTYLGGTTGSQEYHNPPSVYINSNGTTNHFLIMNSWEQMRYDYEINKRGSKGFHESNKNYMKWLLPKP